MTRTSYIQWDDKDISFIYIYTSCISMRWCLRCTKPRGLVVIFIKLKKQSAGRHDALKTHNPDSEPTSLCFYSLMLLA